MKCLLTAIQVTAFTCALCSATSVTPIRPRAITVDYGLGRAATFTFEPSPLEKEMHKTREEKRAELFSFDAAQKPLIDSRKWVQSGTRIMQVEFTFSEGRKSIVAEDDLKGIDIIDVADSEIESLVEDGSWALSLRIKNLQHVLARVADDRAVFIFENYKYSKRWLEINDKRNANK